LTSPKLERVPSPRPSSWSVAVDAGHPVGTKIRGVAQAKPACRAAPGAKEGDEHAQFGLGTDARPDIEAQPRVRPQAVAPLEP